MEHFNRHLSPQQREALTLTPERIFARLPETEALAQFPENTRVDALTVPVEYRFAPGEAQDGANLKVPLLALPQLTRAAVDAAIPGLGRAAHRGAVAFAAEGCAPQFDSGGGNRRRVSRGQAGRGGRCSAFEAWLKERRGIPEALLRFDPSAVPAHLTPQLTVIQDGREIARGTDLSRVAARMRGAGPRRTRTTGARVPCTSRQLAALRAR